MKKIFVFLYAVLVCTIAFAHTIEWYVDNNVYQTTTCDSGENITPPIAPARYGYTFMEWLPFSPNLFDFSKERIMANNSSYWQAHKNEPLFISANIWVWDVGADITMVQNYWTDTTFSFIHPCKANDIIRSYAYYGFATTTRRVIVFINNDNIVISKHTWSNVENTFVAPEGSAYFAMEWGLDGNNLNGWFITKNADLPQEYVPYDLYAGNE